MIKQRLKLAGGTNKALFHDLFASASSEGEEDDDVVRISDFNPETDANIKEMKNL